MDQFCLNLLADWAPSFRPEIATSFIGWPPYLLEPRRINEREFWALAEQASRSERQWKGVLSWMLGVAGARRFLERDGYRWVAPVSAFYRRITQRVDLSRWHGDYPRGTLVADLPQGSKIRLMPDFVALKSTASGSEVLEWAVVEAKGTSSALDKKDKCSAAWRGQANNVRFSKRDRSGAPQSVTVERHVVVATRVNARFSKNAQNRCIALRAWNSTNNSQKNGLGLSGAVEIASASLFGIFKVLGYGEIAKALAASVRRRMGGEVLDTVGANPHPGYHQEALQEIETIRGLHTSTDGLKTFAISFHTGTEVVEVRIAEPLLDLTKDLIQSRSSEEAAKHLTHADAMLDHWVKATQSSQSDGAFLSCGLQLRRKSDK